MVNQIGFKTVSQLIDLCRQHISEAATGFWSDDVLLCHVNDEQLFVAGRILQAAPDYFDITESYSVVSGTQEYDLPINFVKANYCEYADSLDVDSSRIILPIIHQLKRAYSRSPEANLGYIDSRYYLRRNKIGFVPSPTQSRTVTLHYARRLSPIHYGTATAGAATTITFPSTPTAGLVSNINDFYNGDCIYIVSGTGAGQIRVISDYVGSTRVATVSSAWATNPSTDSVYSIISEIPPEFHDILPVGGAIRALAKASQKETPASLSNLYETLFNQMIGIIDSRQVQEPRYVNSVYTEDA